MSAEVIPFPVSTTPTTPSPVDLVGAAWGCADGYADRLDGHEEAHIRYHCWLTVALALAGEQHADTAIRAARALTDDPDLPAHERDLARDVLARWTDLADVVPDDELRWRRAVRTARRMRGTSWSDWGGRWPVDGALASAQRWTEITRAMTDWRHRPDLGAALDAVLIDAHEAQHLIDPRRAADRIRAAVLVADELRVVGARASVSPRVVCTIGECAVAMAR